MKNKTLSPEEIENALTPDELVSIVENAKKGMANAYCIVHQFPVGAAVLTRAGNVYQGCNVETVISGMGTCAERCAIYHAVASGEYLYKAIAVTSPAVEPILPCGMCLQLISEFAQTADSDIAIVLVGSKGKMKKNSVYNMLHDGMSFGPKDLQIDLSRFQR